MEKVEEQPEVTAQRRDEATEQLIQILRDNARRHEVRAEGLATELTVVRRTLNRRGEIMRQLGVQNYTTGAPVLQAAPKAAPKAVPKAPQTHMFG